MFRTTILSASEGICRPSIDAASAQQQPSFSIPSRYGDSGRMDHEASRKNSCYVRLVMGGWELKHWKLSLFPSPVSLVMAGPESLLDSNPYSAPQSLMEERSASLRHLPEVIRSPLEASLGAWATTGLAGGLFGFLLAGFIGAAFGLVIAFITALPVATVIFVVLQLTCRDGVTSTVARRASGLCGAVSGFGSTTLWFGHAPMWIALAAGCTGAVVSALGTVLIYRARETRLPEEPLPADWAKITREMEERDVVGGLRLK